MALSWEQLRSIPTEDLMRKHDDLAKSVVPNLNELRQELVHRDQLHAAQSQWEQSERVRDLTEKTTALTAEIKVLTRRMLAFTVVAAVAAVAAFALSLVGALDDSSRQLLREERRQSCLLEGDLVAGDSTLTPERGDC